MRLVEQIPDPDHLWIRYVPRPWPADGHRLWLDLAGHGLGRGGGRMEEPLDRSVLTAADDVIYLPPVDSERVDELADLARRLSDLAIPMVEQTLAGGTMVGATDSPTFDVLHAVATGRVEGLSRVAAGSRAVWPLIAGYSDDPAIWQEGIARMRDAGVSAVYGIAPELDPGDRRRIVEVAGDGGYEPLFHGPVPSARAFAAEVHRLGLEALPMRPTLETSGGRAGQNRWLAGHLVMIADLSLRLGRGESLAQTYFRAARWIDHEPHDLVELARDGNLGIVSWLDASSREQVEEIVSTGASRLLDELRREYLSGA